MQVTETLNEGLAREFKIVVPQDDIDAKVSDKLKEISTSVTLPGFRPGKVPEKILRRRFGKSIMGEVLDSVVNESSAKALSDAELRPALQPKIEITDFDDGSDLTYDMKVEIIPEITAMDFATLKLERLTADVTEDTVTESLERLAKNHGTREDLEETRPVAEGDLAVIDFLGKVDGAPFDGGKGEDYPLELGSGAFIPGFEEQVAGMNLGDEKTVSVTFPEDYGAEELAGKEAAFEVTLKGIKMSRPAELNDELATKFGAENLDALKQRVKSSYEKEYAGAARQKLKRALLDALAEGHEFDLPPTLVVNELDGIISQIEQARERGHEEDDTKGKSEQELRDEFTDIARRRVKLGLLLAEVGRAQDIQINQDDFNKAMMQEASRYPGQERDILEYYKSNPQALQAMQGPIYEEKVVDYILELAEISEKTVSVDELLKEDEE